MQQQPEAANASPTQNTMPAPAPDGGAMDWQASKSDAITDIAAIQPTLSNLEEEKIDIAASALMNTKVTTSKPAAKFCGPDTTVSRIFTWVWELNRHSTCVSAAPAVLHLLRLNMSEYSEIAVEAINYSVDENI